MGLTLTAIEAAMGEDELAQALAVGARPGNEAAATGMEDIHSLEGEDQ